MKKSLIIGALALAGGYFLVKNKIKSTIIEYEKAIKGLGFSVNNVSGFQVKNGVIKANVKLNIINQSELDLVANTNGYLTLTTLSFYNSKNEFIGTAKPNLTNLSVLKNSISITEYIPIEIPFSFGSILNGINVFNNPDQLIVKPTITAFKQNYTF